MKTNLILIILCLMALPLFSQNTAVAKPDYDKVKRAIQDKTSPYYYPRLFKRFQSLDTTLKAEDYRHLYFGFVFQKQYKPYQIPPQNQQVSNLLEQETLQKKDYRKILKLTSRSLNAFPFNIDQLKNKSYALHMLGKPDLAVRVMKQILEIRNAIKTSGDGKKAETAYHVISVGNEYEFLRSYNLNVISQRAGNKCDYIQVDSNTYGIEGLYFNIEQPFGYLKQSIKQ